MAAAPSWLDDDPVETKPHPPPAPPPPKARAAPTRPAQHEPDWLGDGDGDATPPEKHTPRGGTIVEVDVSKPAAAGQPHGTPPATFMERMAQFEKHRARSGASSATNTPDIASTKGRAVPTPPRPSEHSKCPSPPTNGTHTSPRTGRQFAKRANNSSGGNARSSSGPALGGPAIGVEVGLSDLSRTQTVDLNDFSPLTAEERDNLKQQVDVFGEDTVARSRAPNFQLRVAAMEHIRRQFDEFYTVGPVPALEASFALIARLCQDPVAKVMQVACELFEFALGQAVFLTDSVLECLQKVLAALVLQLRDGRSKVYGAASHVFVTVANHDAVGPVPVVECLCQPEAPKSAASGADAASAEDLLTATLRSAMATQASMASTGTMGQAPSTVLGEAVDEVFAAKVAALGTNWKALGGRLDVCYAIVREHPAAVTACQLQVLALGVAGLNSANSKVRRTAVIFVTELYRTLRTAAEPYFSAITAASTLKLLREEIDVELGEDGGPEVNVANDEQRQEQADIAAFEAEDGARELLQGELSARLQFWRETLPLCRSVACLFSSAWRLRRRVLERLLAYPGLDLAASETSSPTTARQSASTANVGSGVDKARAAVALSQIVGATIVQHIPAVASCAATLASGVLQSPQWNNSEKRIFGLPLVPPLFKFAANEKVADASESAAHAIALVAATDETAPPQVVRSTLASLDTPVTKCASKLLLPRLEVLTLVLEEYGPAAIGGDAEVADTVVKFAVEALRHPQGRVRRGAVDVVLAAYKTAGPTVDQHLAALDGPILDEVKSRIAAMAKKNRSNTAPVRRLATIVGTELDSPETSASPLRPASVGASSPRGDAAFARTPGVSLRQRMAMWRDSQRDASPDAASTPRAGGVSHDESASPLLSPGPATAGRQPAGPSGVVRVTPQQQRKGNLVFS